VRCGADGRFSVEARQPGRYELKTASGKTLVAEAGGLAQQPGRLFYKANSWGRGSSFCAGLGCARTNDAREADLVERVERSGIKYFSGEAVYIRHSMCPMNARERPRLYLIWATCK